MQRRPLIALIAATALATGLAAAPASADPAPSPSAMLSAPSPGFDKLNPAPDPVALRSAPRDLNVTYTYNGQTHTLKDFLAKTTQGFVVLDGDAIVNEWYAPGYSASSLFQSWSMAKSFTSVAIGIALAEHKIASIDDPVSKYVPELGSSVYGDVTVRNLLRMASGVDWTEAINDITMHPAFSLGLATTLQWASWQRRAVPQGTLFNYTSLNTAVLALVLSRATGRSYADYVQDKLWDGAGMASGAYIGNDSHGDDLGYCCFYATDRDFARLGKMMLANGTVGGRQVVPASWVAQSSTSAGAFEPFYGLGWWLDGTDGYYADGLGDQKIYVSTRYHVVIVKSTLLNLDENESLAAFRAVAAAVASTR